jgi:hypothetical protein
MGSGEISKDRKGSIGKRGMRNEEGRRRRRFKEE